MGKILIETKNNCERDDNGMDLSFIDLARGLSAYCPRAFTAFMRGSPGHDACRQC